MEEENIICEGSKTAAITEKNKIANTNPS